MSGTIGFLASLSRSRRAELEQKRWTSRHMRRWAVIISVLRGIHKTRWELEQRGWAPSLPGSFLFLVGACLRLKRCRLKDKCWLTNVVSSPVPPKLDFPSKKQKQSEAYHKGLHWGPKIMLIMYLMQYLAKMRVIVVTIIALKLWPIDLEQTPWSQVGDQGNAKSICFHCVMVDEICWRIWGHSGIRGRLMFTYKNLAPISWPL